MTIQRSMVRGIAVLGAAVSAGVMAPTVSTAAPAQESGSRANEAANVQTAPTATRGTNVAVCKAYAGTIRGCAGFTARGEILGVCDRRADGRKVVGQLYWAGKVRATVLDRNGAKAPCYGVNLSIREGTPVWVRVGVEGLGFSRWYRGTA
jgi:hypothetical protein